MGRRKRELQALGCSDGGNLLRRVDDNGGNLQTAEVIVISFGNWVEKVGGSTHHSFIVLSPTSTPFPTFAFHEPPRISPLYDFFR